MDLAAYRTNRLVRRAAVPPATTWNLQREMWRSTLGVVPLTLAARVVLSQHG